MLGQPSKDYYTILGVQSTASAEEIRESYRSRTRVIHPDRFNPKAQPHEWRKANEMLAELNEAHSILCNPQAREEYDALRSPNNADPDVARLREDLRQTAAEKDAVEMQLANLKETLRKTSVVKAAIESRLAHLQETVRHTAEEKAAIECELAELKKQTAAVNPTIQAPFHPPAIKMSARRRWCTAFGWGMLGGLLMLGFLAIAAGKLLNYSNQSGLYQSTTRHEDIKSADELLGVKADLDAKLRTANSDLAKLRENLRQSTQDKASKESQLAKMKETLRQTIQEKDTAESRIAELNENLRKTAEIRAEVEMTLALAKQKHPGVNSPQEAPPVPPQKLQGIVTAVDKEANRATINLGLDDGVVEGMRFLVYRAGDISNLAKLTVTVVSQKNAAGDLRLIRGLMNVKVKDNVTTPIE